MLKYNAFFLSSDAQWVTFIHGAGGSSAIWYKQLKNFSKEFNVLLIDLRGHGMSQQREIKKWKSYTFEIISKDVMQVLDHLKIRQSHFVGISMGTIIIREIYEKSPDRIISMIMGGAVMKMNIRGQFLMNIANVFKSIVPYLILYRFFAFIIMPRKTHKESRNLFINEAKKLCQVEFKRWIGLLAELNPILKFFRIKETTKPILYIMGEQDYMFLPSIKKLVNQHQSSELFIVENCGHVVNVEQPQIFNNKVIDYLKSRTVSLQI